jgi:hypothetical protein
LKGDANIIIYSHNFHLLHIDYVTFLILINYLLFM